MYPVKYGFHADCKLITYATEGAVLSCYIKKVFLKICQNSRGISFLKELQLFSCDFSVL